MAKDMEMEMESHGGLAKDMMMMMMMMMALTQDGPTVCYSSDRTDMNEGAMAPRTSQHCCLLLPCCVCTA